MIVETTSPDTQALHRSARAYAAQDLAVFPVAPRSKVPQAGSHGCHDATTDLARIDAWWGTEPQANIGIATGAVSGLLVLDVDPRHGGDETLDQLEAAHGPLPETWCALTGGGGRHLLFAYDDALDGIPCRPNMLGPGLDVKGRGGYIVGPPSVHPNGKRYEWEVSSRPGDVPLAPLPPWLLALLRQTRPRVAASELLTHIPDGKRDDTLFRFASALRWKGACEAIITTALQAINTEHCKPPLPARDVARIARSAGRYLTFSETSRGEPHVVKVA